MKLEVGKTYRAKDNKLVLIERHVDGAQYPFRSADTSYTEDGRWCDFATDPNDLTEEVTMEKSEFKVGDIVEAFGVLGRVTDINNDLNYPVVVQYTQLPANTDEFALDGKLVHWHATPSLKLIKRPRKTKKIKVWVNVAPTGQIGHSHTNEATARYAAVNESRITQQIEVEVLDENG